MEDSKKALLVVFVSLICSCAHEDIKKNEAVAMDCKLYVDAQPQKIGPNGGTGIQPKYKCKPRSIEGGYEAIDSGLSNGSQE